MLRERQLFSLSRHHPSTLRNPRPTTIITPNIISPQAHHLVHNLRRLDEDAYVVEAGGGAHVGLVLGGELVDVAAVGAVFVPPDAGGEDGAGHDLFGDACGELDLAELVPDAQPGAFLDAAGGGVVRMDPEQGLPLAAAKTLQMGEGGVEEGMGRR